MLGLVVTEVVGLLSSLDLELLFTFRLRLYFVIHTS
jgi:hypothetical protein